MDGEVSIPPPWLKGIDSPRVMTKNPTTFGDGFVYALAMSRSFGDYQLKKVGVIATPIVNVLDLADIRKREMTTEGGGEELQVFVVSATDGLFQSVKNEEVVHKVVSALGKIEAKNMGESRSSQKDIDSLALCEEVILQASEKWRALRMMNPRHTNYRDDITIAVMRAI
mmetsp:Transcript_6113/g.8036  ORF Transcript_6113/g.8036 Transcript_6113/m.8036 type:complete len:169 (+) Transcript_6113:267-773(+)|eukprot:6895565-Ditylum_brightwellii.AAC.1